MKKNSSLNTTINRLQILLAMECGSILWAQAKDGEQKDFAYQIHYYCELDFTKQLTYKYM